MAPLSRKRDAYSNSPTSVHVHVHEGAYASTESNPKTSSLNEMMNEHHNNDAKTTIKHQSVEVSCKTETQAITQSRDNNYNNDYEAMTAEFSEARKYVLRNMEESLPIILQTMGVANERLHGMSAVGSEVEDVSSIIFS